LFKTAGMNDIVGNVSRVIGITLLIFFVCYIASLVINARKNKTEDEEETKVSVGKSILLILVGIALIVVGGQAVVTSAKAIARIFGMSETLIGLTIVAVGTSLPELVTSIVAARKGETGLAVGNAVGSNIFNLLFILGVSTSIHAVSVNMASMCDLIILIIINVITYIFAFTKKEISRVEGITMLLIYVADVVFAIYR
nr:sodium:calcium antiporter [Lachnospiraceae bacterium]